MSARVTPPTGRSCARILHRVQRVSCLWVRVRNTGNKLTTDWRSSSVFAVVCVCENCACSARRSLPLG